MPRRWFSDRLHDAWGRVAGRRGRQRDQGSQSPQYYAGIVATPDQSPDRASHLRLRRGASVPDLLARAALGRIPPPLPLDSQSLWDTPTPAISPVQPQSSGAIGLGTFLGESEREASRYDQYFIPTVIITTRNTGSMDQGTGDQPWMLPGQVSFTTSLAFTKDTPLIVKPVVGQTCVSNLIVTFYSSQPEHRTLEPCDCCSPKFLFGDWRALTLDPLAHTFTRHESLASSSELRGRDDLNDVFALLLEVLVSPNGLIGQEDELNLPLLLATLSFALDQGMTRETKKLKRTIDRYIPLRMFHHNPHSNSPRLEFEYYEFRSKEVYRAWLVVSKDERLHDYLSPSEVGDPGSQFEQVFQSFFNRTRLGLHSWTGSDAPSGGDQISVTKTDSHEEALRPFGDQPQAQPDGALTLYGAPFQGTRKVPHQPALHNIALRRMSEAEGDSSSRSDGDDEASSDEESDESSVRETTSELLRQSVLDALFTGGAGEIMG
ncbi:hypothetical protein FDENT_13967 [Fusarium denticulatum]|uniref:Uncharacterized protein n=1 Tax=Fusarium denticulatum TaxID=48507 RepID=A0A8H5WIH7_9HYPO|nr:hypothetical protein FDENT_13967 [Fusarium denticulatum]